MTQEVLPSIDVIDKEILRTLKKRRPLVSRQIAQSVGLSPVAIRPRLTKLKKFGIIKISKKTKIRKFQRKIGKKIITIKSPRSIHWDLDLTDE